MSPLYSELSTKVAQGASIVKLVEWQSDLTFFAVYIQPVDEPVIDFFLSANWTALYHTQQFVFCHFKLLFPFFLPSKPLIMYYIIKL